MHLKIIYGAHKKNKDTSSKIFHGKFEEDSKWESKFIIKCTTRYKIRLKYIIHNAL